MAILSALYCYPVKSCRGVALTEATLDARGILHDREFLIVDADDRFITQRAVPVLALIGTAITAEALVLRNPAGAEFSLPWQPAAGGGAPARRTVTVWSSTLLADDMGDEVAAWLGDTVGQRCRLVRIGAESRREVPAMRVPAGFPAADESGPALSFPDGYPLLVVSEESLLHLNQQLPGDPLPMDRFRPNLVVSGCAYPHEEDDWRTYRIGDARLWSANPCERCVVTTTDQQTLRRDREPLHTLSRYRRAPDGGSVIFGQNVVHGSPGATLRVGEPVEVLA